MAKLAIDVFRPGNRVRDFRAQELSETLAEPMHRHFHGPFGQVQMSGNLSVRSKGDTSKRGRASPTPPRLEATCARPRPTPRSNEWSRTAPKPARLTARYGSCSRVTV